MVCAPVHSLPALLVFQTPRAENGNQNSEKATACSIWKRQMWEEHHPTWRNSSRRGQRSSRVIIGRSNPRDRGARRLLAGCLVGAGLALLCSADPDRPHDGVSCCPCGVRSEADLHREPTIVSAVGSARLACRSCAGQNWNGSGPSVFGVKDSKVCTSCLWFIPSLFWIQNLSQISVVSATHTC